MHVENIYKYKLAVGVNRLRLGRDSRFLTIREQDGGTISLWARVRDNEQETRTIVVYPTGAQVPSGETYIGTCETRGGLIWHAFERKET